MILTSKEHAALALAYSRDAEKAGLTPKQKRALQVKVSRHSALAKWAEEKEAAARIPTLH